MSKSLFAAAFVRAFSVGSALTADLPARKEASVYMPPPPMWTGFYLGLNAGGGWGATTNAATVSAPLFDGVALAANTLDPLRQLAGTGLINGGAALANSGIANVNQNGFIGGGQIGYNYQWGATFVVGIEADIQGTTIQGSSGYTGASQDSIAWKDPVFPGNAPCSVNGCTFSRTALGSGQITAGIDWMGMVRGRLGYLFTPTMLVFGTGGFAYGGVNGSATHAGIIQATLSGANDAQNPVPFPYSKLNGAYLFPIIPGAGNYSNTQVGWTAGGGVEWMFMPNWSVKAEALYYDLGNAGIYSSPVSLVSPFTLKLGGVNVTAGQLLIASTPVTRIKYDGVIARAGINYHFNWSAPAPVLANY
jgi:outer membrane immunogenic protein